jgi:hypothetical protein
MEAAVGMFKANLGQSGNETSGRAINARKIEGDTATFHFIDNLARSIEQLGRVVVDMIPRLYDKRRRALVLGLNGEQSFVDVNPKMPEGARKQGGKVVAINPNVGAYDVRVKVGPSFSTQRQETAAQLSEILRSSPDMMAVLGPMWARLQDFPEADKLAKTLLAIAPAPIQALEDEDKGEPQIPPQLKAQMQQMQQALEQMGGALEQASARVQELEAKSQQEGRKLEIEAYKAETERAQVFRESMTPQDVQALVVQMLQQMMAQPDPLPDMPPDMPPGMQMMNEPPPGGFFMGEAGSGSPAAPLPDQPAMG